MKISLFFFLFFNVLIVQAQTVYKQALDGYIFSEMHEKVYLHLDKPQYGASEDLMFKAYLTSAVTHLPSNVSSTLYVELINQGKAIVDSLTLFVENGTAWGSFSLKPDLEPGNFQIRAYTEWMRNLGEEFFYQKYFSVVNPRISDNIDTIEKETIKKDKLIVDFFPEGGDLIDKIPSKVAIKIFHESNSNLQLKGVIFNDKGEKVTDFESDALGYALCFMKPEYQESYLAVIEQDTFQLPEVKQAGAVIKVIHSKNSNFLLISVQSNNVDLKEGTLVIHKRGKLLLSERCKNSSEMAIRIDKSVLGTGIIHFTFFDKNRIPLSERLLFPNPNANEPEIKIISDRKVYKKRSQVALEISSKSDTINSASITINPLAESSYEIYGENIRNYFLLNSDLKGKIEFPDYYFSGTKQAYSSLDLLMLSHGWSRFNWTSLLDSIDYSPRFLPEKGLKFRGKVTDYYNDKTIDEFLLAVNIPSIGMINDTVLVNNDRGIFQVVDLKLMDSTIVFVQVLKEKNGKSKKYVNAKVHQEYPSRPTIIGFSNPKNYLKQEYIEKVKKLNQISDAYFLDSQAIVLEEVVATGKRLDENTMGISTLYDKPSARLILDSLGVLGSQTVLDLLRRVSGVRTVGAPPDEQIIIRGPSSVNGGTGPAFFLDNVPVDINALRYLNIMDVLIIDVLKGADAAIYGARGATGVIAVYSKRGSSDFRQKETRTEGLLAFIHPGYHKAKEFYNPKYDTDNEQNVIPDYRTTLYWNPDLAFQDNLAIETFYSSDQTGSYVIRIEGMLSNGEPFFKEDFIKVE